MPPRIVTDSNAMLPPTIQERFGIDVVPLTVVVGGQARAEDEIDLSWFYDQLRAGAEVTTSAPSPGLLAEAYRAAAAHGATAVLAVHVGSNQSATVDAAHLAASMVDVEVTVVDTASASFIEGCCAWRAAERIAAGDSVEAAAAAAIEVGATAGSVFTIGEIERANAGGRIRVGTGDGVPVFRSAGGSYEEIGRVTSVADAVDLMAEVIGSQPEPLRVGVGDADAGSAAQALAARLTALSPVDELVRYTVGPSVAAHTGIGTFGAVFHPR